MTDSAIAEGQVKLRDGKKWKSRWLVLRKPSPVADCLLLLVFKDKSEKSKGQKERSSVTLEDICGLDPGLSLEGVNHILAIICLGQTVLLAFENKDTMSAWDMRTRYSLGEVHRFHVTVLPGTKLESGPATLHFCNNIFVLVRDVPPTIIGQWKLSDMRRYGAIPNGFVFEGGSRCGLWAGVFCLSCAEGERISFLFDCIVRGISPTKGPFGLRPVLPDPSMSSAYLEEKISHEALELEKRLSLLSQSSRQSSGGDDRSLSSSTESSDTSQSDSASMGSRLTLWPEQLTVSGLQEGHSLGPAARGLGPAEEKIYAEVTRGSKPPPKPPRSRKLQEVGRQSSSDSGIATASHSSYSGSFSSYTGSLDVCQSDEFGSLLSLPSHLPAERTLCTCEAPATPGSEYQVPSSIQHHYDTPRSVIQAAAMKEAQPVTSPPSVFKDQAPAPQETADSQLLGIERGFPSVLEGARDPTGELYAGFVPGWKPQGQALDATGSEVSSLTGTPMPGVGSTDPCEIYSPYPGVGRALFTACLTCGGLKGPPAWLPGTASIPVVPGPGSGNKEKACINKLYGLTEPLNNQYKQIQRVPRSINQTKVKQQGGNCHNSDGDIYGTLWEARNRRLTDKGTSRLGVTGARRPATCNDSSAKGSIFNRSHSMDDRLNTLLERSVTLCGESGAHSKTFARSQQSGAWPSLGKGHRGGGDSSVPAEGDVYERMTTAQHYKSGRRDAVNSSRSLGPIYDLWRKLSNVRDTYNVINDPRKLLGAVGKARTFPGTGDAATRHPVTHGGSPNTMAQPYALIEAPVPERCVPEGHQAAADCGGYKVKEVEGSKSSSWSPGRQQADAELNRADWQLSLWRRGLKELAANDDNGLEARAFDSRKRDEDKKPNKKEEKLKMVAGQMYEFMEAFPTDKQSELEKGSGYEYMASCGQHKLLLEGEGAPGSSKVHRAQGAYLDIVGLKHKKEKGFPEDESSGGFDTKKLSGGAFAYPLELISGSDRSRPAEGATYVNIPVSPTSKKQLHYMELDLQESSPAIRGASSSKYAQIDITATETAHKVGTQHAQNREERLQELEQKRKGAAPQ